MHDIPYRSALIIGAGPGISAAVTRRLRAANIPVVIAARNVDKLASLVEETGAIALAVDASDARQVEALFAQVEARIGAPEIVLYNPSGELRGPLTELDPAEVEQAVAVSALGAFYVVQQAARRMLPAGKGAIQLTGSTASVKGYAGSAPFAMGQFALRGLAQTAARELMPKGIHVTLFVIDGAVSAGEADPSATGDSKLHPDDIAHSYLDVLRQPRSAWACELELRPWVEKY